MELRINGLSRASGSYSTVFKATAFTKGLSRVSGSYSYSLSSLTSAQGLSRTSGSYSKNVRVTMAEERVCPT